MKNINPLGLFDNYFLIQKLGKLGNPLENSTAISIGGSFKKLLANLLRGNPTKGKKVILRLMTG